MLKCGSSQLMESDRVLEADSVFCWQLGVWPASSKCMGAINWTSWGRWGVHGRTTGVGEWTFEEWEMSVIGVHCTKLPNNEYKYYVGEKKKKQNQNNQVSIGEWDHLRYVMDKPATKCFTYPVTICLGSKSIVWFCVLRKLCSLEMDMRWENLLFFF